MKKKIAIVSSNIFSIQSFLSKAIEDLAKEHLIYIYTNLNNKNYSFI